MTSFNDGGGIGCPPPPGMMSPSSPSFTSIIYSVWDGDWALLEEYNSSGALVEKYLQGYHGLIRTFQTVAYYYQDELGSTSHIATAAGALIESYQYDLYGKPRVYNASGTYQPTATPQAKDLGNGGARWMPELGLYDDRNRFMSPDLGRFLQPDPIGFKGDASNLYRYCANDWANKTDPLGLDAVPDEDGFNHYVISPQFRGVLNNPNMLRGSVVTVLPNRHRDERLSGQCAKAGQYLAGLVTKGGVYGAPKTGSDEHPNWFKGAGVTSNTPAGTLVATGWHNGHYPSWSPKECETHGVPVNHVGILVSADSKSVTVIDQFVMRQNGNTLTIKPLDVSTHPLRDWSVVRVPASVGSYDSQKDAMAVRPQAVGSSGPVLINVVPQASNTEPSGGAGDAWLMAGLVLGAGRGGSPTGGAQ